MKISIAHYMAIAALLLLTTSTIPMGDAQKRAIFSAIRANDIGRIRQLLQQDPQLINAVDLEGITPLHRAQQHGDTDIAHLLIERGADVNAVDQYGDTPLSYVWDPRLRQEPLDLAMRVQLQREGAPLDQQELSEGPPPEATDPTDRIPDYWPGSQEQEVAPTDWPWEEVEF